MEQLSERYRHHVGVIVPDMERAREELRCLYGDLPGLDFVYEFRPDTVWTDGKRLEEPVAIRICMLDWVDGKKMELLQPVEGTHFEHATFLQRTGGGVHHVAYYVPDAYPQYRSFLLEQGADILFESETDDDRGHRRCCYLRLPGSGLVVEIAEPPRPHPGRGRNEGE